MNVIIGTVDRTYHQEVEQRNQRQGNAGTRKAEVRITQTQKHDENNVIHALHDEEKPRIALGQRSVGNGDTDRTEEHIEHRTHRHGHHGQETAVVEQPNDPGHEQDEDDQHGSNEQHAHVDLLIDGMVQALRIVVDAGEAREEVCVYGLEYHAGIGHHQSVAHAVETYDAVVAQVLEHLARSHSTSNTGQHIGDADANEGPTFANDTRRKETDPISIDAHREEQMDEGRGPTAKHQREDDASQAKHIIKRNGEDQRRDGRKHLDDSNGAQAAQSLQQRTLDCLDGQRGHEQGQEHDFQSVMLAFGEIIVVEPGGKEKANTEGQQGRPYAPGADDAHKVAHILVRPHLEYLRNLLHGIERNAEVGPGIHDIGNVHEPLVQSHAGLAQQTGRKLIAQEGHKDGQSLHAAKDARIL